MIRYSQELEKFINFLKSASTDYGYYLGAVSEKEKEKTDLEHELELGATDAKARNHVSRELQQVLRDRREFKNVVECTEPIAEYLSVNRKLINELGTVLGKIRKAEKYHETRCYKPRRRTDLTIGAHVANKCKEE